MAVISEEQRIKEIEAQKAMLLEADKLSEDEKKTLAEQLEVRDRLFRRLHKRRVVTKFKDDLGEFQIESRLMKGSERKRFLDNNKLLTTANNDSEQYGKAMDGLRGVAADIIQIPQYPRDYWLGDDVTDDVILTVVLNVYNGAAQAVVEGVESFRPK